MRYRVWPYRQGSKSAMALATALGGRVLKRNGSRFVFRKSDVVLNWGDTDPPPFCTHNLTGIREASNKLLFFRKLQETGLTPPFWENAGDIPDEAFPVVCRTVLAGHSGDGIVIAADRAGLVDARLYVKYVKKQDEYRVHVGRIKTINVDIFGGEEEETAVVIATQRKARRHDTPDADVNWQIRNHDNGFVFVRGDCNPNDGVLGAAQTALLASGLDFGAVDVIWNEREQRAYVLEINTAPGLEGQTVEDYKNFFTT